MGTRSWIACIATAAICSGCVADVDSLFDPGGGDDSSDPGDNPPPGDPPPASTHLGALLSPRLGDVIPGDTATVTIGFTGFYDAPGATIQIQALADPDQLDSWTTVISALTADSPEAGVYRFAADGPPGLGDPARWPQGGVVRLRAIDPDGAELPVFGQDADDCLLAGAGQSWTDLIASCGAGTTHAVLVSPSPTPLDAAQLADLPRLLDRKGSSTPADTEAYYQATAAPATLDDFRAQYGFDPATELHAVFYNAGDLGTGREMHCTQFASPSGPGVACYVSNYGIFGTAHDEAVRLLAAGADSGTAAGTFAHVAMVYTPPLSSPNSVSFAVYGPDGGRIDQAQLDTVGDNVSVPENCLNCHGVRSSYSLAGQTVTGARFLPFDPASFDFAPGYDRASQEDTFRRLNQLIAPAASRTAVDLIGGMYAAGTTADDAFVPAGWSGDRAAAGVYRYAIATSCRSCHGSADLADGSRDPSGLDFASAEGFKALGPATGPLVCGGAAVRLDRGMPNAEIPTLRMWTGPARAYLVDYLGITGACTP